MLAVCLTSHAVNGCLPGTRCPSSSSKIDRWVFNTEAHPLRVHPEYRWGEEWGSMPDEMPPSSAGAGPHATGSAAAKDEEWQEVRRRMRARAEALEVVAAQSRHVQE